MNIPDELIAGLKDADGPVLINFKRGVPVSGFLLRKGEFVTSLRALLEARERAGLPLVDYEGNPIY